MDCDEEDELLPVASQVVHLQGDARTNGVQHHV